MDNFIKFLVIVGYGFFQAWMAMLALGMIASWVLVPGLAIGFWATFVVTSMLSIAFSSDVAKTIRDS